MTSINCPQCNVVQNSEISLLRHCNSCHQMTSRQLYVMLHCVDQREPTCACGCGEAVKYVSLTKGFSKFRPGHQSRVNNNWGHNNEARNKSQITIKRLKSEGKLPPWNKGLTAEQDIRLQNAGELIREKFTNDRKLKSSKSMSDLWKSGQIAPLRGENHPAWKGGISSVRDVARSRLYSIWTYPILKDANFSCSTCQSTQNLEVHHDRERFSEIFRKVIGPITTEDYRPLTDEIAQKIVDYHVENRVSGVVLCRACHDQRHKTIS